MATQAFGLVEVHLVVLALRRECGERTGHLRDRGARGAQHVRQRSS